jgi:hypothetical protein
LAGQKNESTRTRRGNAREEPSWEPVVKNPRERTVVKNLVCGVARDLLRSRSYVVEPTAEVS